MVHMVNSRFGFRSAFILPIVLLLVFILSGCAGPSSGSQQPAATTGSGNLPAVSAQPIAWTSDGTISDNEYTQFQQIGDLQVFTRLEGDLFYMALRSQNDGYLALGIRPENKMQGADVIICTLTGTQIKISDAYATGIFGPHPEDTQLGGTNDLLDPSGSKQNGWSTFEFKRKLSTGDKYDKDLVAGDNPIIWSIGGSVNTTIHHDTRGYATLVLK
jgi:hypothetical protein